MESTAFPDESDTKYLVFANDTCDDEGKNYSVKSGGNDATKRTESCTTRKLGLCLLLQLMILMVFAIIMVVYIKNTSQTTSETQELIRELQDRVNTTGRFGTEILPGNSKSVALQSTTSRPLNGDQYKPAGVTYIRWGRTVCPDTADRVYTGIAAGGKGGEGDDNPGGGSNYLCLTRSPQFNQSEPGQQPARATIYGAEYRSGEPGAIHRVHGHDTPCSMCQSRGGRVQVFMMPATTACPAGWTREYAGYLAAARWNHPRTQYVCLDRTPEIIRGTDTFDTISFLFHVEVVSSSGLPDEYVTGHDLTCAICTM